MEAQPYHTLSPEIVLAAIDSVGFTTDGRLHALASYENRVYQVGIEDAQPVVAKFYRPQRWSDEQILEEHAFIHELVEHELPCVPPLASPSGQTLYRYESFRFAVFPRQGGHPPNLEVPDNLVMIGRTLARIHAVGRSRRFVHRPKLDVERMGHSSRRYLLENDFLPKELEAAYSTVTEHLLARIDRLKLPAGSRIHGDCHPGNVLWRDDAPHFVDFDDSVTGPAVQDLWMLLSGERADRLAQIDALLEGYEQFLAFDDAELALIEPLRTLRLMHHAAWIARRWHDPAFPRAFPWFNTMKYWSEHVLELREQQAALDEPALQRG
jgi:Ser/Thr protein kinase RdoA (MazF antagonist)